MTTAQALEIAKIGFGVLVAYVAYRLALRAYFRQKEFENVRERYLESGVELACSQIDYALGVHRHNWMLMLRIMKQYRDLEAQVSMDDLFQQFVEVDQSQFQITPMHKIHVLLGDVVVWEAYQKLFSFVGTSNDKIKSNFGGALKVMIATPENPEKQEFLEESFNLAKQFEKDSHKFSVLLARLQELSELLERENLDRAAIAKLASRKEVKNLVTVLRTVFPEEDAAQQSAAGDVRNARA